MKYIISILFSLISTLNISAQINCDALYEKDTPCYNACMQIFGERVYSRADVQGSLESQTLYDSVTTQCNTFANGYYGKAIPYLKRGEFITWKQLIDKAVENDSTLFYLAYRGGARFMFLRDYEGAIEDIEKVKNTNGSLGAIYNGDLNLEVVRALSYRGMGDTTKAIEILTEYVCSDASNIGFYDYFYLAVMLYQTQQYTDAEEFFYKQIESADYFAETYYYLAMLKKETSDNILYQQYMQKAHNFYTKNKYIPGLNSFMDYPDKVYLAEIERNLNNVLD